MIDVQCQVTHIAPPGLKVFLDLNPAFRFAAHGANASLASGDAGCSGKLN